MGILDQFADKRVLIVDDERNIAISLAFNLEAEGIRTIQTAGDGLSALELQKSEPFDLILLNNYMPRMRGPEVLAELRRRGDWVPVVMHTTSNREELDLDGLHLAAFVQTPFSMSEYIETVREVLKVPPTRVPPLATSETNTGSDKLRRSRKSSPRGGKRK